MSAQDRNAVKVGSRKSELALIQTHYVISLLKQLHPTKEFEIVTMTTLGDRVLNISLPKIGEKSLFTKDLEEALENGSVDLVVHSLKDLPTALPEGMAIGAVLEREDPRDALILREDYKGHSLDTLPPGSIIGTSSLRRTAQLSRNYPHLKVVDIRGNLNTRLKKLDYHCKLKKQNESLNGNSEISNGKNSDNIPSLMDREKEYMCPDYAALILAHAGLVRMKWQHRVSQVLPSEEVLYAVGQGALAVECRANNTKILEMLAPLNHKATYCRILSERSFLKTLGGGCSAPVAISTSFMENEESNENPTKLDITGAVWSLDGKIKIENSIIHSFDQNEWSNGASQLVNNTDLVNGNLTPVENSEIESNVTLQTCPNIVNNENENINSGVCCKQKNMNMAMEKVEPVEIENLINIHGKLFYRCPFVDVNGRCPVSLPIGGNFTGKCPRSWKDDENSILLTPKGACPISMPIGEDYMGKCPLSSNEYDGSTLIGNIKESIQVKGEELTGKYPHSSESVNDLNDQLVKLHPKKSIYDIRKCPFMSNQIVAVSAQMENKNLSGIESRSTYDIEKEPKAKNCPFLKRKNHTLDDVISETSSKKPFLEKQQLVEKNGNVEDSKEIRLYCGLTKHFDIPQRILEKCEDIGVQLAQSLIKKGALEVMKCAQDHIRSSIPSAAVIKSS